MRVDKRWIENPSVIYALSKVLKNNNKNKKIHLTSLSRLNHQFYVRILRASPLKMSL